MNSLEYNKSQPEIWKLPIKQGSQELTNLLSALLEYSVCSKFNNTHPLTSYLVKELIEHCQSLKDWSQRTIFFLHCGSADSNWMHQLEITISQSHTNKPLNRVNLNCNWTSIYLGECKITNIFWLPDGSPLQVRIDPVENLPAVVVIPIPARTAEFANLFVTLSIASRNLATPTSDTTENQRLVDLLAYMKANLGTYTGVSLTNLLHKTCNFYDLEFKR